MAINMFEGARRIAKLIAVFIVVGFGIAIVTDSAEHVRLKYAVTAPNQPPVLTEACPDDSATTDVAFRARQVYTTLCFLPTDVVVKQDNFDKAAAWHGGKTIAVPISNVMPPSGEPWKMYGSDVDRHRFIPYSKPPSIETIGYGDKDFQDVSTYIDYVAKNFRIPPSDEGHINGLWWSQTLKNAGMYFLGMLASLAGWWAFTWTVGWIVRGFMGIPRGSDSRE